MTERHIVLCHQIPTEPNTILIVGGSNGRKLKESFIFNVKSKILETANDL